MGFPNKTIVTQALSARWLRFMPAGVIALCSVVLWWAIGRNEIQPWDEGFYAMRALAVVEKGVWLDQTPYALGGLYTSTYPPLTIWATALSILMFGTTEFAVRFYGALCGTVALALLYGIARFSFEKRVAIIAPVLLAGTVVWNNHARLGMLDIPLVMWMLLALWATLHACKSTLHASKSTLHARTSTRSRLPGWCLVVALAMAAGLMTKIVLALLPLLFLVYAFRERGNTRTTWAIVIAMATGIVIALPWHLWMMHVHGFAFSKAFMLPHVMSTIEGSGRWLGALFYINQLIVAHPFSILVFTWLAAQLIAVRTPVTKRGNRQLQSLDLVLVLWFVGGLIVFSFAATKMMHYTVVIIPPMILLGLRAAEYFYRKGSSRTTWSISALVLVSSVWSSSQFIRDAVQGTLMGSASLAGIAFLVVALALLICAVALSRSFRLRHARMLVVLILYIVPATMLVRVALNNASTENNVLRGARAVAIWLEQSGHKHFYYACQEYDPSDSLAPNLAWYTRGWTCGWRLGYTMTYVPSPLEWIGNGPVVYLTSADSERTALFTQSMHGRELVLRTDSYLIYE